MEQQQELIQYSRADFSNIQANVAGVLRALPSRNYSCSGCGKRVHVEHGRFFCETCSREGRII